MELPPAILNDLLSRRRFLTTAAGGVASALAVPALASAQEKSAGMNSRLEESVSRGLAWLKKEQAQDGYWEAGGGQYRTAMTALAGMCFLMEGSTLREGKYREEIKKAVEWFLSRDRLQDNGLLADNRTASGFRNYMHGHGYATLFLACAYGEAEDGEQQQKIEKALKIAVAFIAKAQTQRKHPLPEGKTVDIGGWGYVSAADRNFDEGSVTVTQLQALRAARNAAIEVPKETIDRSVAYLEACTTPKGGIIYSYTNAGGKAVTGAERSALTAAAVACAFSAGEYTSESAKKWIKYCKDHIQIAKGRVPHDEYQNYYYSQFMYILGDDRYGEMFPNEPKDTWLMWSKFRDVMYPYLMDQQDKNSGAWTAGSVGPVFVTSVNLTILQLEKGLLPIYQR